MASCSINSQATEIIAQRLISCFWPAVRIFDPPRSAAICNINPLNLRAGADVLPSSMKG